MKQFYCDFFVVYGLFFFFLNFLANDKSPNLAVSFGFSLNQFKVSPYQVVFSNAFLILEEQLTA